MLREREKEKWEGREKGRMGIVGEKYFVKPSQYGDGEIRVRVFA